jgi:hypothetical protein
VLHHHHQLINLPTAGAQVFLMNYPQGERGTGHNPPRGSSADWWVLATANIAGTNGCTLLPKHGARDNKFLVTHPMTDQFCLAYASVRRAHWPRGHQAPQVLFFGFGLNRESLKYLFIRQTNNCYRKNILYWVCFTSAQDYSYRHFFSSNEAVSMHYNLL